MAETLSPARPRFEFSSLSHLNLFRVSNLEFDPKRELLILYHIERLQVPTLGAAHGMSVDVIDVSLGYAEKQFTELLQGLSGWDDKSKPDVGALLVELADCIDLPWAEALGEFALRYAAEWNGGR
jgi:hypothetical protein